MRALRTSLSDILASFARRASEKPCALRARNCVAVFGNPCARDTGLGIDDGLDLSEKPRIDLAILMNLVEREAFAESLRDFQDAVEGRPRYRGADDVLVVALA